jgi:hypothetical protein
LTLKGIYHFENLTIYKSIILKMCSWQRAWSGVNSIRNMIIVPTELKLSVLYKQAIYLQISVFFDFDYKVYRLLECDTVQSSYLQDGRSCFL